jgi:hypothetical protein
VRRGTATGMLTVGDEMAVDVWGKCKLRLGSGNLMRHAEGYFGVRKRKIMIDHVRGI